MKLSKLIDVWSVPVMVGIGAFLFWYHTIDAPAVATRVPHAVLICLILLMLIVVRKTLKQQAKDQTQSLTDTNETESAPQTHGASSSSIHQFMRQWSVQIFFGLGVLYFLTFEILGFSISNFIFVSLSMALVKNYQSNFVFKDLVPVLLTASITTVLLFMFAKITSFNIPTGIFGI